LMDRLSLFLQNPRFGKWESRFILVNCMYALFYAFIDEVVDWKPKSFH
jgi:hypothetical protein